MDTAVHQKASLIFWILTPQRFLSVGQMLACTSAALLPFGSSRVGPPTVVLVILLHQTLDIDPEMADLAHLPDPLGRENELGHIPEVLTHSPDGFVSIDGGLVPLQKLPSSSHVLGNGFLREDMLACKEGLLDEVRLD